MTDIPSEYHDLFERETIAHIATMTPDGMPHVTPVWIDHDPESGHLVVNTERERMKARNAERDSRVGVSMTDPDNPYRRLSVMGIVDEITTDGAREHIDTLSQRYTGSDYGAEIESERVKLRIKPQRVF